MGKLFCELFFVDRLLTGIHTGRMSHRIFWKNGLTLLSFILALGALPARADVVVQVTMFSLAPNPVNIVTGEAVFWTDGDGGGPYGIYANNGAWSTVTDDYGIRFMQAGSYRYYDDNGNDGTINVTVNIPPSVTITNPVNHAVFSAPASFSFGAAASDTDVDGLSDVEFYVGTNWVDDIFSEPFTTSVTGLPSGSYTLTAIAYDNAGATATNSIAITVATVAPTNYILPVVCASIYSSGTVLANSYLTTAGNIRGGLEFAVFDATPYSSIMLALNPYGLPLFSLNVDVYGFDGGTGMLAGSNFNSGTLLGTLVFPTNVDYGQVATFDVTRFVQSAQGPYFGFILQAPGPDNFSSLTYNYGTPPELIAVPSTLPPTLVAKLVGSQLVIAWNTNNATGLCLQSTTNLASSSSWTATTTPALIGSRLVVTNPIVGAMQFFRLSNP